MKKTTFGLTMLASLLISNLSLQAQVLDVADAVRKGLLSVTAEGAGGHSGECIELKLKNKSNKKLQVRIPAGQIFEASDSSLQNLMIGKEEIYMVESGNLKTAKLFGFCIEASDGSPGEHSLFRMGKMAEGNLLKIAKYLNDNKQHQNPSAQYAVWAVSDSERLEGIGDPTITKFVADMIGKPMPEYHIRYQTPPQDRLLPGQAANSHRDAVALNGLFYYDLGSDQKLDFGLYDETGKLVHSFFKDRLQKRGQHKFRFEFEIFGLPKGKYFARLTNKGVMMKELSVEF